MTKLYATLILLFIVAIKANGQLHPSVKPLKENGYSVQDIINLANSSNSYDIYIYDEMLSLINQGLYTSGEFKNLAEYPLVRGRHDKWIGEHISIEYGITLKNYTNSYQDGNIIDYFPDDKKFTGAVFVFKFGILSQILAKTACLNVLKIPPTLKRTLDYSPEFDLSKQKKLPDEWDFEKTQNNDRSMMLIDQPIQPSLYIPNNVTTTKRVADWGKIAKIGGITVGVAGAGILAYSLLKKGKDTGATGTGGRVTPGSHESGGK